MTSMEEQQSGTSFLQKTDDNHLKESLAKETMNDKPPNKTKLQKEKRIGHRRVDASTGQTTYKNTPSYALSGSIQRGISHTVAGLSSKPERDVLMQDFQVVETIDFPSEGSNITPAHHFDDFTFRTFAPTAFRYFRDLFGIRPDDYMLSISQPLTELSNPGASGSLFFVTQDDEFIIKTVQHKEAEFLQKLLPGYYMNLVQNPRTLLPKFYGLYRVQAAGKNIRVVVMNNLLPRRITMHTKFDLKGSTYKRKASKYERAKKHPVLKDLDLLNELPKGLMLEPEIYNAFIKTMQRDCLVLQSFKIMDYSLLLAIHNVDQAEREKSKDAGTNSKSVDGSEAPNPSDASEDAGDSNPTPVTQRKSNFTKQNTVLSSSMLRNKEDFSDLWAGGIPAKNSKGERLLLFCGVIDILQCYKLKKKLEHTFKSMIADGDTVSVHKPGFYCRRFQEFMTEHVFKKHVIKTQPSHRLKPHPSRRLQHFSSTVGSGKESAAVESASSSSSAAKQQSRPDLLPTESPRPNNLRSDEEAKASKSEISDSTKLIGQGSNPPRETTFSVQPDSGDKATTLDKVVDKSLERGEGGAVEPSTGGASVSDKMNEYSLPLNEAPERRRADVKNSDSDSASGPQETAL